MARECDLTGKKRLIGHKVSHSNIKTKMKQQPNLQTKRVFDPETGQTIKLRLSTRAIRTLDKVGSLSKFLRKYSHLYQRAN
jgi:large subunit ribosomal protein L28